MRDMKFRAWDKVAKKMYDSNSIAVAPNNGRFSEWCISGDGITIRVDSKRFILMQYTGFKDSVNKKEIYSDDLIKRSWNFKTLHGTQRKGSEIGRVSFDEQTGQWEFFRDLKGLDIAKTEPLWEVLGGHDNYTSEIIGNVHDNPELLEES
ncbi:hypothetical protein LCGC14_1703140 [marine sediment metagenome]|uniref:YopX protein domain-containing protein n=1 Tax=marine sediment metagenome TaxID=412755 RepID=A0A0F9I4Y2_9ZZZZ